MRKHELTRLLLQLDTAYNVSIFFSPILGENEASTDGRVIYYGYFTDLEKLLFAIFHELAHLHFLCCGAEELFNFNRYPVELIGWAYALSEAGRWGLFFHDDTIQWGFEQANTYFNWAEKELTAESYEAEIAPMLMIREKYSL